MNRWIPALLFLFSLSSPSAWGHRDVFYGLDAQFYCAHAAERATRGHLELSPQSVPQAASERRGLLQLLREFWYGDGPTLDEARFDLKYRDQALKGLASKYDRLLKSFVYYPAAPVADARFNLTLTHGMGAKKTSHAGASTAWERTFLGLDRPGRKLIDEHNRLHPERPMTIYAETFDLPESGNSHAITNARRFADFADLWVTRAALAENQKRIRREHPRGKNIWGALSASCGLAADVNAHHPGLIQGLVLMGFLHPKYGFKASYDAFYRESALPVEDPKYFEPNWPAFHWVNRMYREMTWHETEGDPFRGTPTLILIGEHDEEVNDEARAYYRSLAERFSHIRYVEVKGAGHNVLGPRRGYNPDEAYRIILKFMDEL